MTWHQSFVPKLLVYTSKAKPRSPQLLFCSLVLAFWGLFLQNFFRGKSDCLGRCGKKGAKIDPFFGGNYCFEENGCLGDEKRVIF